MKTHASYWLSLISLTTAALCAGLPSKAAAQSNAPAPATAPPSAAAPALPYGVQEVLKMQQGGISKDIIIHYIESSTLPLHLTADGIIYLQHTGMPGDIVSAMLHRDGELQKDASAAYQQQMAAAANMQPPPAAAPDAQPPVAQPSGPPPQVPPYSYAPAPSTTVVAAPPVVYPDYYPYYGYPYYYGPNVVIGGGWGWGGRGWGPGWRGGWGGRGGWHR